MPRLEPSALGLKASRAAAEPDGRPNGSTRTAARPNPVPPPPPPAPAPNTHHTHTQTHTHTHTRTVGCVVAPLWECAPLLVGMFPCLPGCTDAAHRATRCRTRGRRLYSLLASSNTCSNAVCNDGAELQSCDAGCIRPQRNTDEEVCLGMSYSFLFVSSCASMQTVQKNKKKTRPGSNRQRWG